jgi:hypothetical protein
VRAFGFGELSRGHVPLWNPHVFSGTPFVAAFQPALYYPLNVHYLVLPLARSINLEIVLHMYLLGAFMFAWARGRGLSTAAALIAALLVQYSGPYYLNALAGHLSYLGALAWTPLMFLAVDKTVSTGRLAWAFAGATGMTMSILAGHPQALFCTLAVLVPYAAIGVIREPIRIRSFANLAAMFIAPPLLAAPQLWPALALANESVRAGGLHYILASSLSFPPENLLTFAAPSLFGDSVSTPYTGRWFFWETCAFMGIGGASLAVYGAIAGRGRERYVWLGLALLAGIIALGRYTPIYQILFTVIPGVDSFRCPSRHFFHATMFLALLAGVGLDELISKARRVRTIAAMLLIGFALFGGFAACLYLSADPTDTWSRVQMRLNVPGETRWTIDDVKIAAAGAHAATSLGIAAATCLLLAVMYGFTRQRRYMAYGIAAVGILELVVFAWTYRASADLGTRHKPGLIAQMQSPQPDARVFDMAVENYPLDAGLDDMWGYDSTALLRYAQLIAYTQGTRAEHELTEFSFKWFHPLYAMLRCQYIIDSRGEGKVLNQFSSPLPRALLVHAFEVIPDSEARFAALADPQFNPKARVILETAPVPAPGEGPGQGTVQVRDITTDSFLVDVRTSQAALLVITDAYANDWRATSYGAGAQASYTILPANHVLRAIPLAAGVHHIRLDYAPAASVWGLRAGIAANLVFIAAWIGCLLRSQRKVTSAT